MVNRVPRNTHDVITRPMGTPHAGPLDQRCFLRGFGLREFGVKLSEGLKAGAVVAEAQRQLPGATHHAGGEIDELLHHRTQPLVLVAWLPAYQSIKSARGGAPQNVPQLEIAPPSPPVRSPAEMVPRWFEERFVDTKRNILTQRPRPTRTLRKWQ